MNLTKDIWTFISKFLCFVDQMALKRVCKKTSRIKLDFKKIILDRLSRHIDNPKEFCDQLVYCRAVISGSFIIACLYDTNDYKDIDVFDQQTNRDVSAFSNYLWKHRKYEYTAHIYDNVYMIRNFIVKETTIENVIVYIDPIKYINATFDMDICKSYFDGNKLIVKSWDKLIQRRDFIKPNGLLMTYYSGDFNVYQLSIKRMAKYINRGFDITFHPKYEDIVKYVESSVEDRCFKQTAKVFVDLSQF